MKTVKTEIIAMSEEIKETEIIENDTSSVPEEPEREIVLEEAIEAILFAAGHPITYTTLARVFESTPMKIKERVIEYSLKYNNPEIPRGVILLTYGDSCQLCTKKYYLQEIRDALGIRKSGTLSTSSMEALAIVAYNQPVTRAFVDTLRRADSSYAMNNLIDRGLIESKGRLDVPGRPMLYGTTSDFLRAFGLKDLDSLPTTTDEIKEMFEGAKTPENSSDPDQVSFDFENVSTEPATESAPVEADVVEEHYDEPSADDYIVEDDT